MVFSTRVQLSHIIAKSIYITLIEQARCLLSPSLLHRLDVPIPHSLPKRVIRGLRVRQLALEFGERDEVGAVVGGCCDGGGGACEELGEGTVLNWFEYDTLCNILN